MYLTLQIFLHEIDPLFRTLLVITLCFIGHMIGPLNIWNVSILINENFKVMFTIFSFSYKCLFTYFFDLWLLLIWNFNFEKMKCLSLPCHNSCKAFYILSSITLLKCSIFYLHLYFSLFKVVILTPFYFLPYRFSSHFPSNFLYTTTVHS